MLLNTNPLTQFPSSTAQRQLCPEMPEAPDAKRKPMSKEVFKPDQEALLRPVASRNAKKVGK
jgi:hypothetical protein